MFLKPFGSKVILGGTIGLALLLIGSLWDLYGNIVEQWHRDGVLASGKEASALVVKSSGLQSVILSWTDFGGQSRTGEARTRKQVSSVRFIHVRFNRHAKRRFDGPCCYGELVGMAAKTLSINNRF